MGSRERGATHVNVIWVVALVVLVIFAAGGVWAVSQDRNTIQADRDAARAEKDKLDKQYEASRKELLELSNAVGFKSQTAEIGSNLTDLKGRIAKLQDTYKDLIPSDPNTTTLEICLAKLEGAFTASKAQLAEKEQALKGAQSSREEGERTLASVTTEKDKKISEVEQSLADEREKAANSQNQADQQKTALMAQVDEAQAKVREMDGQVKSLTDKQKKELQSKDVRIAELVEKQKYIREPEKPDGKIISRAPNADLAYIDIGGRNLLHRGTRFAVMSFGKGGVAHRKGMVEVKNVNLDEAEVTIIEEVDRLDPIVAGDSIAAPYYDRDQPRHFVFLGRFPTSYNKNFVKQRLEDVGAKVDEHVSPSTDFLVYGEKENVENAPDLSETDDFKKAQEFGVQIISVNDMLSFVRYSN